MAHGGNSHQRRKARRLESRRRVSWRETAIRLWGCVPRSATEVAILNGAQWGKSACFDRCRLPAMKEGHSTEAYLNNIYRLADELRHGSSVEMWTTSSDGSGVEVMGRMDVLWHNRTDQEVPAGTLVLWDEMAVGDE